ncbi:uncharacterized protein LOC111708340 [Eurytemora carolleeae]|uniref:uncharacterized protein LOC111708340 n=1 Tax=Eurytemora carolleeae TaxID=1294199 RepID=UPI000C785CB7|nr:uncharacterized protein LOC111708340 [Eurytemora carolleeae]|eukprot:XP_023337442.1 uncharacterized protein LOC111708340 [Eurytemora affinis]
MHGIIVLNRNGPRRPINYGRRRRKLSPFKTSSTKILVLWIIFTVFVFSSSVLFFILLYLDLVLREKNSKELALCCGAFSVSLLTALRIWISLPDDYEDERYSAENTVRLREQLAQRTMRPGGARESRLLSSSGPSSDIITIRNDFLLSEFQVVKPEQYCDTLPPSYSSLDLALDPPNYEEAIRKISV